jgi:two-component system OmpR family response regulator
MTVALAERAYDPPRVLVVDDDDDLRDQICRYLVESGFEVEGAFNAVEMGKALQTQSFDAIVLDVMMPGEDGLSVCRRLSRDDGPAIVFLSALGEELDRILGLELGADDYLTKPCNPRELLARLKAVLRRRAAAGGAAAATPRARSYAFEGFRLDLARRRLTAQSGAVVALTAAEFSLLLVFLEHPETPLSREQLSSLAGVGGATVDRAIDVLISRLRRKLDFTCGRDVIRTVRGEGYMFSAEVSRR